MRTILINTFVKITNWLPDKLFLKLVYFVKIGKFLNLKNPQTYNEKSQYLKLVQRSKKVTLISDKYAVRAYIAKKIGNDILTKLYWVGEDPKKIPFDDLPKAFVIKCNHGSGYNIIVPNKEELNKEKTIKKLDEWMKDDFWKRGREYNYKDIKKKILIEEHLGNNINDYKFLCFDGIPELFFIATDRGIDTKFDFFDMNFNHLPFRQGYKNNPSKLKKPKTLKKMIEISKKLSEGFPHIRVDLYEVGTKIYFGELTFYHFSGWEKFHPDTKDKELGKLIKIKK